jgi:hypothetical protein
MYQLTDADLKKIEAWFFQDVPCKNGVSLIEVIKTLSAENVFANIATEPASDIAVAESTVISEIQTSE